MKIPSKFHNFILKEFQPYRYLNFVVLLSETRTFTLVHSPLQIKRSKALYFPRLVV